jgi:glycosyltransferase involved in cell wall biosynthesis
VPPPPRVSVVVPSYNAERFLAAALDSALEQSGVALEVVVVDDGSSDGTGAILSRYADRIRVAHQDHRGPAAARNAAIREARGEYVALLDADDRFRPGKLARQTAVLDGRPDVGIVYTGWDVVDGNGNPLPHQGWSREDGDVLPRLLLGNLAHPVAVLLRRAQILDAGGFDETLQVNEDWDLFLRLTLRGARWACVDAPLCEYRVHGGQSHRRVLLVYLTRLRILEGFFARPDLPPEVRAVRAEAFHEAYLVGAAELFAAGQRCEAQAAFLAAVRARPESLRDPLTMRRFVRLLQPTGWQHQTAVVDGWREVMRTLWGAVEATLATPGLEPEIAGQRWAARRAVLRTGARLLRKRLGRSGTIAAPVAPRQSDR